VVSDSTPAPDILYHDQWLIAIDKPAGLLVHRSPIDHHETRNAMQWLRDRIGQWVYPLHRLDKATSGLLLFALDTDTARQMGACFEAHRVHKRYLAVVRGFAPETTLDHPLRDIAAFKSERCEQPVERAAITHFRLLQRFELPHPDGRFPSSRYSLVEACPKTGRKHQIRRHLKHLSHPIIGDVRYGKGPHNRLFREHFDSLRLLLAATDIEFVHPVTGQLISIHCPPDASFAQMLQKLEPWIVSR
jgi:tRNA pseudouridine65 synthase